MEQNSFVVFRDNATGRIMMDHKDLVPDRGVTVVQNIFSNTWQEARELVDETNMFHIEGYGWFDGL